VSDRRTDGRTDILAHSICRASLRCVAKSHWRRQLWLKGSGPPPDGSQIWPEPTQILLNIFRFVKEHCRPKNILHLKCTRIRHFQTHSTLSPLALIPENETTAMIECTPQRKSWLRLYLSYLKFRTHAFCAQMDILTTRTEAKSLPPDTFSAWAQHPECRLNGSCPLQ